MQKTIYETIITSNGLFDPKRWMKSLCEVLLNNVNDNNVFQHAVLDEPFDIEELVYEQYVKINPDLEEYAGDIIKFLIESLYAENCISYNENSVLIEITLLDKFFELCKELGVEV